MGGRGSKKRKGKYTSKREYTYEKKPEFDPMKGTQIIPESSLESGFSGYMNKYLTKVPARSRFVGGSGDRATGVKTLNRIGNKNRQTRFKKLGNTYGVNPTTNAYLNFEAVGKSMGLTGDALEKFAMRHTTKYLGFVSGGKKPLPVKKQKNPRKKKSTTVP